MVSTSSDEIYTCLDKKKNGRGFSVSTHPPEMEGALHPEKYIRD